MMTCPSRSVDEAGGGIALSGPARQIGNVSTIASNPVWLPHRYDPQHDAIHFRHTPRAAHGAATFLTDEYLGDGRAQHALPVADCLAGTPPQPMGFLFHSAFCGSTMLLSALAALGSYSRGGFVAIAASFASASAVAKMDR